MKIFKIFKGSVQLKYFYKFYYLRIVVEDLTIVYLKKRNLVLIERKLFFSDFIKKPSDFVTPFISSTENFDSKIDCVKCGITATLNVRIFTKRILNRNVQL